MKLTAIKNFLHKNTVTKKEITFMKEFLKENQLTLSDLLPEDQNTRKVFLMMILREALKEAKNNISDQEFIEEILLLEDAKNDETFYQILLTQSYGIEVIRKHKEIQQKDKKEILKDMMNNGVQKSIIEYVQENKKEIDIDFFYENKNMTLNLVESLEKEGYQFDKKIIHTLLNSYSNTSVKNPKKFIDYMSKYKTTMTSSEWDSVIFSIINYFSNNSYMYENKGFKDTAFLILELQNPSNYKWGQEVGKFHNHFRIEIEKYLEEESSKDKYYDIKNKNNFNQLKDFFKTNPMKFENLNIYSVFSVFKTFINELSDEIIEDAIKNSWNNLYNNKTKTSMSYNHNPITIEPEYLSGNKELFLLNNKRTKKIIFNLYFNYEKNKLENYYEEKLLKILQINKESLVTKDFFVEYKDILTIDSLNQILKTLRLNKETTSKVMEMFLVQSLDISNVSTEKKLKI